MMPPKSSELPPCEYCASFYWPYPCADLGRRGGRCSETCKYGENDDARAHSKDESVFGSVLLDVIKMPEGFKKVQDYFHKGGQSTLEALHCALDFKRDRQLLDLLLRDGIKPNRLTLQKALNMDACPIFIDRLMRIGSIVATTRELNQALERRLLPVTISSIIRSGSRPDDTSVQLAIDGDYSEEIISALCENLQYDASDFSFDALESKIIAKIFSFLSDRNALSLSLTSKTIYTVYQNRMHARSGSEPAR